MSDNRNPETEVEQGDIDPEVADLISLDSETESEESPKFESLFGGRNTDPGAKSGRPDADTLPQITRRETEPQPFFTDKNYYKIALGGEGEAAKRLHAVLSAFLSAKDPEERSLHRNKMIPAYWNLAESVAVKAGGKLPLPKALLLRFGALLPTLFSALQRQMLSKVVFTNATGEPVHYVDEWFALLASGRIEQSATDEVKVKKGNEGAMAGQRLAKAREQREAQKAVLTAKLAEMGTAEKQLAATVAGLMNRAQSPSLPGAKLGYSDQQRAYLTDIGTITRQLSLIDKEVSNAYQHLEDANRNYDEMRERAAEAGAATGIVVDNKTIHEEFNTIKQMAKMCVGRQGNHLPLLMKQYFRDNILDIGTRENVIAEMAGVEALDDAVFKRTFKQVTNRIVPHVILVPCYGDRGVCWEPFERFNRATSRGRIAVPMYPKDLKTAVITALADLRWQVAKERAQHYWMEEGLTGHYYQWFNEQKRKGDVREAFVFDYVLWITKESEGTQKLDREVRGIFWRYLPFPQEIKEKLKNRGFLYAELYKRDKNREMSDGY